MSSLLSGRLIQPCEECGTELRLSSMTVLASLGAIGLLASALGLFVTYSPWLLICALLSTLTCHRVGHAEEACLVEYKQGNRIVRRACLVCSDCSRAVRPEGGKQESEDDHAERWCGVHNSTFASQ
jgi:hypothetical protein